MHNLKVVKNENGARLKDLLIEQIQALKADGMSQADVLAHNSEDQYVQAITNQSKIKRA